MEDQPMRTTNLSYPTNVPESWSSGHREVLHHTHLTYLLSWNTVPVTSDPCVTTPFYSVHMWNFDWKRLRLFMPVIQARKHPFTLYMHGRLVKRDFFLFISVTRAWQHPFTLFCTYMELWLKGTLFIYSSDQWPKHDNTVLLCTYVWFWLIGTLFIYLVYFVIVFNNSNASLLLFY